MTGIDTDQNYWWLAEARQSGPRGWSYVAGLIPGFMIDATLLSHRTLSFSNFEKSETPDHDSGWQDGGDRVTYFYPGEDEGSCLQFEPHRRMTVILDQRASCDFYPPAGLCVYDAPIEIASEAIAKRYGQAVMTP